MAIYNVLSWRNENALTGYPIEGNLDVADFIVDAKFVQFDRFIPVLEYIMVQSDRITMAVTFDSGLIENIDFMKSAYLQGEGSHYLKIYTQDGSRYLGCLSFGSGAATLWESYVGRKMNHGLKFMKSTVRSIPSKDAVYSVGGLYGDVNFSRVTDDTSIFFNKALDLNALVFNAVDGHDVENIASGLRQINLVKPVDNNVDIASNDVIKLTQINGSSLTMSLVGESSGQSFIIPTLAT